MAAGDHNPAFLCDGSQQSASGGTWIGHLLPAIILSLWGLHWFLAVCLQHLTQLRTVRYTLLSTSSESELCKKQREASAQQQAQSAAAPATHRLLLLEPKGLHLEAWLKLVLPCVAIYLEFSLSGTRSLLCPPGSAKAGELDVKHMNSWSHATNYPPIILSGFVDLVHAYWRLLPAPIPHAFLAFAFASSSFLMLSHTKEEALDGLLHWLLGMCMAVVAAMVMAHGMWPRSFALGVAKSLALMMEGAWFFAITHIMFSVDIIWAASQPEDATRLMFAPVLFAWIFTGLTFFLLLVCLAVDACLELLERCSLNASAGCCNGSTGSAAGIRGGSSCAAAHTGNHNSSARQAWLQLCRGIHRDACDDDANDDAIV